ncbi:MAG TPA: phosphoribosylformylglycinamidine cyclo-ligase [Syntrophobacteraceae bacterium]|nr:phosphoribosylformylglycinamidine cyclo-ligase [Syntrophobacteraceae bacterium]
MKKLDGQLFEKARIFMGAELYREAGVDLDKANELVWRIRPIVRSTYRSGVITDIGGFGGLFSLNLQDVKNPVLVSSTDGVGTKLKVAFMAQKHDTVGIDLVAMCVNDILVQGAKPLFFLDYLALGRIDLGLVEQLVAGIAAGCKKAGCSLIGGETAEMPDFYKENEYDMAGFAVGLVDKSQIIDGSTIRVGHQIIGLPSSGLHSNGYSLVRRVVFDKLGLKADSFVPELGRTVAEELLEPTTIYTEPVLPLLRKHRVHGMAHITGGGFYDNVERILPRACKALIRGGTWSVPRIFDFIREKGDVSAKEMNHVFNNGIGFVVVVEPSEAVEIASFLGSMLPGVHIIGDIVPREPGAAAVEIQ